MYDFKEKPQTPGKKSATNENLAKQTFSVLNSHVLIVTKEVKSKRIILGYTRTFLAQTCRSNVKCVFRKRDDTHSIGIVE